MAIGRQGRQLVGPGLTAHEVDEDHVVERDRHLDAVVQLQVELVLIGPDVGAGLCVEDHFATDALAVGQHAPDNAVGRCWD